MIKQVIYTVLIVALLTACTKFIDFSPDFEGDKMVINGFISTSEGVKIKLTHSINPVGKYLYSDSLLIEDAVVSLYENGVKLTELHYSGKGFYNSLNPEELNFSEGKKYKLIVQSTSYGKAESEEIILPKNPIVANLSFVRTGEVIYGKEYGLFSFTMKEPNDLDSYFFMELIAPKNEYFNYYAYKNKEDNFFFEGCKTTIGLENSITLYSNVCGFTNSLHQYSIQIQNDEGNYDNELTIHVGTVSREIYEYAKSYNNLDALDYGFAEPPILKSNIIGGYGLFYARNSITYPIPKP